MTDTFIVTLNIPASDSLFRDGLLVMQTPTGTVDRGYKLKPHIWRGLTNEELIRDFVEARLIRAFPARAEKWHGSRTLFFHQGAGITAIIAVDCDSSNQTSIFASLSDG